MVLAEYILSTTLVSKMCGFEPMIEINIIKSQTPFGGKIGKASWRIIPRGIYFQLEFKVVSIRFYLSSES